MVIHTALEDVVRELEIIKQLCHPNLLSLYEIIDDDENQKLYMSNL